MTEQVIIDVQVNAEQVAQKLSAAMKAVKDLKAEQKELTKAIQEGNDVDGQKAQRLAEVNAEIDANSRMVKSQTALLQASTQANVDNTSSLDEQRQALNTLQKAYAGLSGEEKTQADQAGGLRDQIKRLSDSIKEQEGNIGDNRRNVGNYTESIIKASQQMGFFGKATQGIVTPIKNATLGLKAMLAIPVLAILNVLITIIMKLSEKFKQNGAAMEKMTVAFSVFEGVGVIVNKIIDKIAEGVIWLADKLSKFAEKLGLVSDEMRETQRIAKEEQAILKQERETALQGAIAARDAANLRAQANEKDKRSTKERIALLEEAARIEQEQADRDVELARRQYELQKAKNAQSNSSQEDLKKENDLQIALIKAEEARANKQKDAAKQVSTLRLQAVEEAKKAAAVRLEIERALEDALIALDEDAVSRQIAQTKKAGEREVENLKVKLNNLKQTDTKARADLQRLILAKEEETQRKISDIQTKAWMEREQKARANALTEMTMGEKDSILIAEARLSSTQEAYKQLQRLTDEQRKTLYQTEADYDAALLQAEAANLQAREDLVTAYYEREALRRENDYQKRLQSAQGDDVKLAQIEYEQAVADQERLVSLDDQTKAALYADEEQFAAAVIAAEGKVAEAKKKAQEAEVARATATLTATANVMGGLESILNEFADANEDAAKASKAIALGKVAVETGVAIASGVAQAQSELFPANLVAMATTIAAVLANIATATQTIKSAKFATGGIVGGSSYVGDKVTARVNSGEMILNKEQQARLFEIANTSTNSGQYDMLYSAMSSALENMKSPTLVYSEFQQFQRQTATIKEITMI